MMITVEHLSKHTTKAYATNIMNALQKGFVPVKVKQVTIKDYIRCIRHVDLDDAISFYEDLLDRDKRPLTQVAGKKKLEILKGVKYESK